MIITCIILVAILTFLRTHRRVTEQRRYPTIKHHLTTYTPKQLQEARSDRRVRYW